jgi:hypothetical protein
LKTLINSIHACRQLGQSILKKASRYFLHIKMPSASKAELIAAERRLRGKEQFKKLQRADVAVVSFGKSGRTWLRVMLSRLYQVRNAIPERYLIGFDNYHAMNKKVPKIFFTHDNYIKDYTGNTESKADFYCTRVVVLVRDPCDVAVSQYFQWKFRMKPNKKALNDYPLDGSEVTPFDFVMDPDAGLKKVIDFMNLWARESDKVGNFFLLRYEDMKSDPQTSIDDLSKFIGTPASIDEVKEAVEFGAYENMKKMEQKQTFWLSGGRMVPKDRNNPDSFKVRRAKVGGYRDYFSEQELAKIDQYVDEHLDPVFGYSRRTTQAIN